MDTVFWILISLLFVLSFIGVLFPVVPSVFVLWGGFLLYQFGINKEELSVIFWVMMTLFTGVLLLSDFLANSYFVKKYGGSKWGERVAVIAVIVGAFVFPPFGILLVPFVAVFFTERIQKKTNKESLLVAFGSLIGFLGGTLAKIILQMMMIAWFFMEVIF